MRKVPFIIVCSIALLLGGFAWLQWLEAKSSGALLENFRRIHPQANLAEVTQILGPADYTFEAPAFPPWLEKSTVGKVKQGTVLIYTIKGYHPKLLIIHLLPDSGVQFITWEST